MYYNPNWFISTRPLVLENFEKSFGCYVPRLKKKKKIYDFHHSFRLISMENEHAEFLTPPL
jgi:hypothetical protein